MTNERQVKQDWTTSRDRTLELVWLLLPDWRPTVEQVLWTIRIIILLAVVLGILVVVGSPYEITLWEWLRVPALPITVGPIRIRCTPTVGQLV